MVRRRRNAQIASTINASNTQALAIMPGMIAAHMHFYGVQSTQTHTIPFEREPYRVLRAAGEARKMLEAGITAARCPGNQLRRGRVNTCAKPVPPGRMMPSLRS